MESGLIFKATSNIEFMANNMWFLFCVLIWSMNTQFTATVFVSVTNLKEETYILTKWASRVPFTTTSLYIHYQRILSLYVSVGDAFEEEKKL